MKVVLAGSFPFPTGSASAARIRNLARGLKANGAAVDVIAFAPTYFPDASPASVQELEPGITYQLMTRVSRPVAVRNPLSQKPAWFARVYGTTFRAYWRLRQMLRANKYDLFIGYGGSMALLGPLVRLCRQHNVVTLMDVVELRSNFSGFGGKLSPIYWDWYFGEKALPHWFDGITVIASGLQSVYEQVGCRNFLVVPSIEGWAQQPASLESTHVTSPNCSFTLVYVSTLIRRDAPEVLFDAMRILGREGSPVRLLVVGKFRETNEGRAWAVQCETDPILQHNIHLVGRVNDAELQSHLQQADGLILTRRNDRKEICSFPTRLVEYLQYGHPVFVSAVGDIPMYLRSGIDAVLLDPDHPELVAERIREVAAMPDRGQAIGLQGWEQGSRCFNREHHAAEILRFAMHLGTKNKV